MNISSSSGGSSSKKPYNVTGESTHSTLSTAATSSCLYVRVTTTDVLICNISFYIVRCTAHHICPLNYPSSKILYTAKCFLKMKIQKTDKMYKEVNWLKQVVNLVSNSIQFFCYVWTLTKEKVHLLANTTFPISWSTGPKVVLLKWIEWYDEDQLWWDDATFLSKSQFLFFFSENSKNYNLSASKRLMLCFFRYTHNV